MSLDQQLRAYIDGSAGPIELKEITEVVHDHPLPSPADSSTSPSRRWALALAAVVTLVVCLGAVLLANRLGINNTNRVATEPVRGDSSLAQIVGTWTLVDSGSETFPTAANDAAARIRKVVATDLGYFALGSEQSDQGTSASLWRSPDGVDWQRAQDQPFEGVRAATGGGTTSIALHDIVKFAGRYFLVGTHGSGTAAPIVYTSEDGDTWVEEAVTDDRFGLLIFGGMAATSDALVVAANTATGFDETDLSLGPVLWRTTDGISWTQSTPETFSDTDYIAAMTPQGSTLVAVGATTADTTRNETPKSKASAWISEDDGESWTTASMQPNVPTLDASSLNLVADTQSELLLATGSSYDLPLDPWTAEIDVRYWTSTDGSTWVEQKLDGEVEPGALPNVLVTDRGRHVLTAAAPSRDGTKFIERFWSANGRSKPKAFSSPAGEDGWLADVFTVDGEFFAIFETTQSADGPSPPPRIWRLN